MRRAAAERDEGAEGSCKGALRSAARQQGAASRGGAGRGMAVQGRGGQGKPPS